MISLNTRIQQFRDLWERGTEKRGVRGTKRGGKIERDGNRVGCEDLGKALRKSNGLGKVSRRRLGLDKALREAAGDEGDRRARRDEEQLRAVVVAAEDAVDRSHLCEGLLCAQSDEEEVDIRRVAKGERVLSLPPSPSSALPS